MDQTWVVVAEGSRARFFRFFAPGKPMKELEDLLNPDGRAHEHDLISDHEGRSFNSRGSARHSMQAPTTHKEQSVEDFSRKVAEHIEHGRTSGQFEDLVLVAAPEFLGLLRKHLGDAARGMIRREVPKNVVRESEDRIRAYVEQQ